MGVHSQCLPVVLLTAPVDRLAAAGGAHPARAVQLHDPVGGLARLVQAHVEAVRLAVSVDRHHLAMRGRIDVVRQPAPGAAHPEHPGVGGRLERGQVIARAGRVLAGSLEVHSGEESGEETVRSARTGASAWREISSNGLSASL